MDNMIRTYLFTGFLNSGKSSFINDTLLKQDFCDNEKTLLIVSEEGEVAFDEALLKTKDVSVVYLSDLALVDADKIHELTKEYQPTQVIFEVNGMWDVTELIENRITKPWQVVQVLTMIDTTTFNLYFTNMRGFLYQQIKYSDLIICNRCTDDTNLIALRSNLKATNSRTQIIYENTEGKIVELGKDNLPFDINQDYIEISDIDYGIFCVDVLETPNKYENKTIKIKGKFIGKDKYIKDGFILGRMAMVCCENDMQLVGLICTSKLANKLIPQEWIQVTGKIKVIFDDQYNNYAPVLEVAELSGCKPLENEYVSFV